MADHTGSPERRTGSMGQPVPLARVNRPVRLYRQASSSPARHSRRARAWSARRGRWPFHPIAHCVPKQEMLTMWIPIQGAATR
jgi:hypothetical protein